MTAELDREETKKRMAEKFIKAYCERSGRYFGLRIEEVGGKLRCTDFYNVNAEDAKALASTVDVPQLETAANLRPCFRCGARRVSHCTCASSVFACSSLRDYRFPCLYCKNLHVYSQSEGSELEDSSRIGSTIRLAQGQEVVISPAGSGALEHILVGVGWDIALQGDNMDVDSSVVMKGGRMVSDLIYFGNLEHPSGCIQHMGDNLYGGKGSGLDNGDSENIHVYLRQVPESCDQLYFVLNIFNADSKGQTLRDVRNMYIRLSDGKSGRVLVEYHVEKGMERKTGMIIGKAYRAGSNWKFKAIGKGLTIDSVHDFDSYCTD